MLDGISLRHPPATAPPSDYYIPGRFTNSFTFLLSNCRRLSSRESFSIQLSLMSGPDCLRPWTRPIACFQLSLMSGPDCLRPWTRPRVCPTCGVLIYVGRVALLRSPFDDVVNETWRRGFLRPIGGEPTTRWKPCIPSAAMTESWTGTRILNNSLGNASLAESFDELSQS